MAGKVEERFCMKKFWCLESLVLFQLFKKLIKSLRASSRISECNFSSLFTSIEYFNSFTTSSSNQVMIFALIQQSSIQQNWQKTLISLYGASFFKKVCHLLFVRIEKSIFKLLRVNLSAYLLNILCVVASKLCGICFGGEAKRKSVFTKDR